MLYCLSSRTLYKSGMPSPRSPRSPTILLDGEPALPAAQPPAQPENQLTVAGQLMLERQAALRIYFAQDLPLTRENFAREITLVARAAVAEAEYQAAAKLYEIAGKHLGAITPAQETHQHVHLHQNSPQNDFARATDAELQRIISESQNARQQTPPTST